MIFRISSILVSFLIFPILLYADTPQQFFQEGLRLRNEGKLNEAEHQMKHALESDPANSNYRFELASVYAMEHDELMKTKDEEEALHKLEDAARELEQAVMLQPDSIPAQFNLGVVYKKLGRYEEARQKFKNILEKDPNLFAAVMQIGSTYEEQGFFDEAQAVYLEARDKNYTSPEVQTALDDLEHRKAEARERALRDENMNRGLNPFTPNAMRGQRGYEQPVVGGQGVAAALPYLGSWVFQQFMKARDKKAANA